MYGDVFALVLSELAETKSRPTYPLGKNQQPTKNHVIMS